MTTVLVANRGEVALRVFRTARRLGMRCAAVYSDADADAPFVNEADVAVRIGPAPAGESYLVVEKVVAAAVEAGADLVHPGYGFLAEDPDFASACLKAGLTFVGPSPEVLSLMGSKTEARKVAERLGVPVSPGYFGDQSERAFAEAAQRIGYPVIVKPVAGGGGKGMSVAHSQPDLLNALASAKRVAAAAFDDDRLFMEKLITRAHHVEVQILGDGKGGAIHLFERDCSIQRRHQKVIEESPSPVVDENLREKIFEAAVALASDVEYSGAGTVEFLVDSDKSFFFIEMNARLQVEHPVTEMITGVDLVERQLSIAMGEGIGLKQPDVSRSGHAIEARVYAEDPHADFIPQAGTVEHLSWPPNARIDTGVEPGSEISIHYDPMIAKVILAGPDRNAAIASLRTALEETEILGLQTNIGFLTSLLDAPEVLAGSVTTGWLEDGYRMPPPPDEMEAVALAAVAVASEEGGGAAADPWVGLGSRRLGGLSSTSVVLRSGAGEHIVAVTGEGPFRAGGLEVMKDETRSGGWVAGGERATVVNREGNLLVWWKGRQFEYQVGVADRIAEASATHLEAPMPGQVIAVRVNEGDKVVKGQELVVVEAMKMEHSITAPADGVVEAVFCSQGDQVERGKVLVDFEPA